MMISEANLTNATKGLALAEFWLDLELVIWDIRWMLLGVLLCVVADFRFGWKDSQKHYGEAKEAKNAVLMDKYKWHTSRAVRRTGDKLMSYITWIIMGAAIGKVVLAPFGVNYTFGGVVASAIIICFCELPSCFGHFFNLYGVSVEKKTIVGFFKAFAVAFARRKSPDMGDALNEGFKEMERNEKSRKL